MATVPRIIQKTAKFVFEKSPLSKRNLHRNSQFSRKGSFTTKCFNVFIVHTDYSWNRFSAKRLTTSPQVKLVSSFGLLLICGKKYFKFSHLFIVS